jgi:hypothetical protein
MGGLWLQSTQIFGNEKGLFVFAFSDAGTRLITRFIGGLRLQSTKVFENGLSTFAFGAGTRLISGLRLQSTKMFRNSLSAFAFGDVRTKLFTRLIGGLARPFRRVF